MTEGKRVAFSSFQQRLKGHLICIIDFSTFIWGCISYACYIEFDGDLKNCSCCKYLSCWPPRHSLAWQFQTHHDAIVIIWTVMCTGTWQIKCRVLACKQMSVQTQFQAEEAPVYKNWPRSQELRSSVERFLPVPQVYSKHDCWALINVAMTLREGSPKFNNLMTLTLLRKCP